MAHSDGNGRGKGATATLLVSRQQAAEGRIANTIPNSSSADEGVTAGVDDETAVTSDYKARDNLFVDQLRKIVIEVK